MHGVYMYVHVVCIYMCVYANTGMNNSIIFTLNVEMIRQVSESDRSFVMVAINFSSMSDISSRRDIGPSFI